MATPTPALEQTIGLQWAGWIGAVVLTIGAALGVKFAYDQHWFELLPPVGRLSLMSLASVALLASGEVVYRRVNRISAASLFGAGVALAFVVSYAGHGYYDLYGRDTAFVLMGLSTLLGCGVALRGGMVSIATLSLIGGNLAPLILRSQHPRLVPFLAYLLMLQVVALCLSAWGHGGGWRVLRAFSLATTAIWIAGLLASAHADAPYGATFGFMLVSAALFHGEAIFGSRGKAGTAESYEAAAATGGFTVLVTALLTAGLLIHLGSEPAEARAFFVLALAGLAGVVASTLARARRLSGGGAPAMRPLETAYLLQCAGLTVAAAPVALSGVWVSIAWAAMAVTFAAAGAALDLKRCRRAAVVVWTLAGLQLLLWSAGFLRVGSGNGIPAGATWATVLGHAIPAWAFAASALAITGHVIGALVVLVRRPAVEAALAPTSTDAVAPQFDYARPSLAAASRVTTATSGGQHDLARYVDAASAIVWLWAALAALPTLGATLAVAAYGLCLLAAGRAVPRPRLTTLAVAALVFAGAKWMVVDTTGERLSRHWSAAAALTLVNAQAAVGVLVAAAMFVATRLLPRAQKQLAPALVTVAALCLFWMGTTEIDRAFERAAHYGTSLLRDPLRAKQFAISVYWALSAAACVVAGFKVRSTQLRLAGLGLLGVTLVKLFLVDMAQVQTGYRVLSFVALGLLLLATSVLYGRLAPRMAGKA